MEATKGVPHSAQSLVETQHRICDSVCGGIHTPSVSSPSKTVRSYRKLGGTLVSPRLPVVTSSPLHYSLQISEQTPSVSQAPSLCSQLCSQWSESGWISVETRGSTDPSEQDLCIHLDVCGPPFSNPKVLGSRPRRPTSARGLSRFPRHYGMPQNDFRPNLVVTIRRSNENPTCLCSTRRSSPDIVVLCRGDESIERVLQRRTLTNAGLPVLAGWTISSPHDD